MKRLLFAALIALIPGIGWAGNTTLNVTIPGSGTPLGFYQNASTYYPENVITNPLVPTQNWLIDSRGYGPMTEADGANVTLGSVADPVYPGSGSATAIGLLKGIYSVAAGPIVNFPALVDTNTGAAGASTIRVVLSSDSRAVSGATTTQTGTTVTTGGTFQSALASSGTRKGCGIFNPPDATEFLYVFFGATGSATTSNAIKLAAGQSVSCGAPGIVLTDNVAVTATTTGHAFQVTAQ